MIVIGYLGIGKTTAAKTYNGVIDLGTDAFWDYGKRPDGWNVYYCKIATQLSKDGNIVFVNPNSAIQRKLIENNMDDTIAVYPSAALQNEWIQKMERKYVLSKSNSDLGKLERVKKCFTKDILKMSKLPIHKIEFSTPRYDLMLEIVQFVSLHQNDFRGAKNVGIFKGSVDELFETYYTCGNAAEFTPTY